MFEFSSSFRTKNDLELHKKVCEDFCNVVIPSPDTKILEFNQCHKSDKTQLIIYVDFESLIEEIDGCQYNPEKLFTTKVTEHIPSAFSIPTISLFKDTGNKHDVYRGKD